MRTRAAVAAAVLVILAAVTSTPAAAEPLDGPVAEIVAAEHSFEHRCAEIGIRPAFKEYLLPSGVAFDHGPTTPEAYWTAHPIAADKPQTVTLTWAPEQAEVAPAGDLGWTSGPSLISDKDGKPKSHGYYFSLWRKQPDGKWKVELDLGVETPAAPRPAEATRAGRVFMKASATSESGTEVIRKQDEALCGELATGAGAAYAAVLAPNARVYRDDVAPLVGETAWRPWAAKLGKFTCKPGGANSSSGPGFGYSYGRWQSGAKSGSYVRVWRWDGHWTVAVDLATDD